MRTTSVHSHYIETPFGNLGYKISEADTEGVHPKSRSYGARTVYFEPVGEATRDQAIVPLNSGVFTPDSTHVPDDVRYEPKTPGEFLRTSKPVTVNGKEYRNSFTATRYTDGTYLVHSGFHAAFTDAARAKLSAWFEEHDADIFTPNVLAQLRYDRAYNDHVRAQDEQERLSGELNTATQLAFDAWHRLTNTPKP